MKYISIIILLIVPMSLSGCPAPQLCNFDNDCPAGASCVVPNAGRPSTPTNQGVCLFNTAG